VFEVRLHLLHRQPAQAIVRAQRQYHHARPAACQLGIDARRVATISYGKERPAVVGSNEAAWSQNRRSVMVVN